MFTSELIMVAIEFVVFTTEFIVFVSELVVFTTELIVFVSEFVDFDRKPGIFSINLYNDFLNKKEFNMVLLTFTGIHKHIINLFMI